MWLIEKFRSFKAEYYIATYAYQSSEPGDLTFDRGDLILVTKMEGDWWSGSIGSRSGIFPCNYVKEVDEIEVCESLLIIIYFQLRYHHSSDNSVKNYRPLKLD